MFAFFPCNMAAFRFELRPVGTGDSYVPDERMDGWGHEACTLTLTFLLSGTVPGHSRENAEQTIFELTEQTMSTRKEHARIE